MSNAGPGTGKGESGLGIDSGAADLPAQVSGFGGGAVTPHHLATWAAVQMMARGANAVDAAVAANAVLGVVAPETCGIGGDLFALVHRPGEPKPDCLNASGRAGSGVDGAALRAQGLTTVPYSHPASVTAPGCVDGWEALLSRFGTMGFSEVLAPAIDYAERGFAASTGLSGALGRMLDELRTQPSAAALLPNGRPPEPGTKLKRPDLARTLRAVAENARTGFYEGPAGSAIAEATGGALTPSDLAVQHAEWPEPLGMELHGLQAWTVPPNSQGFLTLAAAWLFEQLAPQADFENPVFTHLLIEAFRAAAFDRDDVVADPGRIPQPASELVDPGRLAQRLTRISPDRRADWPSPTAAPGGTAYLCVIDASGVGISLIQSNFTGLGGGIGAGDAGFLLHNRGAGFNLQEGHPNELTPGRRPLHTLSPTLWTRKGDLRLLLGTRGGYHQPQLLIQAIAQLFELGREPAESQAAPRWIIRAGDQVHVEEGMPSPVVEGLQSRGHTVAIESADQPGWGPISMISIRDDGSRTGASDPRVDTALAVMS